MNRMAGLRGALVALAMVGLVVGAARPARAADEAASGRAWLGVMTQTLTDELRDAMDLTGDGALVSRVVDGSPADRAGVEKGDVIVRFAGQPVRGADQLIELVRTRRAGDNVTVEVRRGKDTRTLSARLDTRPASLDGAPMIDLPGTGEGGKRMIVRRHAGDGSSGTDDGAHRIIVRKRLGDDSADKDDDDADGTKRIIVRRYGHGDAPEADDESGDGERRVIVKRIRPGDDLDIRIPDLKGLKGLKELKGLEGMGPGMMSMSMGRGRLGVRVQDLNEQLGEYFQVPDGKGALVMEVVQDTPAERVGLRAGDVITKVGDTRVEDASDLVEALQGEDGRVRITVVRKGQTQTFEPELEKPARRTMRMGEGGRSMAPAPPAPPAPPARGDRDENAELRDQIRQLRQELRELREQIRSTR